MNTTENKIDWQGHRGARGLLPENTIPSFLKAMEYPVTTLELDIAISKDDLVIVSHEPWFNHAISTQPDGSPVTEENENQFLIYKMTYEEIKKFDVGIKGNQRFPDQVPMKVHKPSLKDLVKAVNKYCKKNKRPFPNYNIEIKSSPSYYGVKTPHPEEYVKLVLEAVNDLKIEKHCNLQSFDIRILEEIKKQDASMVVAYLVENLDPPDQNLKLLSFQPEIYSPYYLALTQERIDYLHGKNIKVIPWTVNEKVAMQRMVDFGVDGIITDYPNYIESIKQ